jgi:membrane-bound lytic murein transglycosylase B
MTRAPGTIPSHVNPPRGPVSSPDEPLAASMAAPAQAPAPATRVASAVPSAQSQSPQSDGFFSNLARKVGLGGSSETTASAPVPAKPKVIEARRSEPPRFEALPKAAAPKATEPKQAAAAPRPPLKPSLSDSAAAAAPAANSGLVAGSQPIVPANSFDSRFGAMK